MANQDSLSHLTRLAQKPGVRGTLILSRDTGAIVRASGLARQDNINTDDALPALSNAIHEDKEGGAQTAEDIARIVWNFSKLAADMLGELNGPADDEVKLFRIRSKKKELVIVPGTPCAS